MSHLGDEYEQEPDQIADAVMQREQLAPPDRHGVSGFIGRCSKKRKIGKTKPCDGEIRRQVEEEEGKPV